MKLLASSELPQILEEDEIRKPFSSSASCHLSLAMNNSASNMWTPSNSISLEEDGRSLLKAISSSFFSLPSPKSRLHKNPRRSIKSNTATSSRRVSEAVPFVNHASPSASAPYELLVDIFRFTLDITNTSCELKHQRPRSLTPLLPSLLVCKHWHTVASDVLYEAVEPVSYASARLLIRTLIHDQRDYREKIKVLRLPLISPSPADPFRVESEENQIGRFSDVDPEWRLCKTDAHGIPYLITRNSLELLPDDFSKLSRDFSRLISLCPYLEELHAPCIGEHAIQEFTIPTHLSSSLRSLVLTGYNAMNIFARDILLNDSSHGEFWHLESVSIFEFNTHDCLEKQKNIWSRIQPIKGESGNSKLGPSANLSSLHLQRGVLNPGALTRLLQSMGSKLSSLHISNVALTKVDDTKHLLKNCSAGLSRLSYLSLDFNLLTRYGIDISFLSLSSLHFELSLHISSRSRGDQELFQPGHSGRDKILQTLTSLPRVGTLSRLSFVVYMSKKGFSGSSASNSSLHRNSMTTNIEATLDTIRVRMGEMGVDVRARLRHTDQEVSLKPPRVSCFQMQPTTLNFVTA